MHKLAHRLAPALLAAALAVVAPALAQGTPAAPAADPTRGALLYDTHCIACHTTQLHWRDKRVATDWASLRQQVQRWQGAAGLAWNGDDIDAVALHLNQRFYRFRRPTALQ